jgi:hypothetical protein
MRLFRTSAELGFFCSFDTLCEQFRRIFSPTLTGAVVTFLDDKTSKQVETIHHFKNAF